MAAKPALLTPASLATTFAEHEHRLDCLSAEDRRWVAEHMPEALNLWVGAIRNRARPVPEIFHLTVDGRPLQQMIAAGAYDWASSGITQKHFPITADQLGEWEEDVDKSDLSIKSEYIISACASSPIRSIPLSTL